MLLEWIRKIVPIRYRQGLGLWTLRQVGRSKLLLNPYFLLLCGKVPKNLTLTKDDCYVFYQGRKIFAPCDGILAFIEVLQDRVYEMFFTLHTGDVIVDIGAYVGMFTVRAALTVGGDGKVLAIEPAPANIEYLRRNTQDIGNIRIVAGAAGRERKDGLLTVSNASPCHSLLPKQGFDTVTVRIDTLDSILREAGVDRVDLIKIDAEGSEMDILAGATETLKQPNVKLAVAAYHDLPSGEPELYKVAKFLTDAGFKIRIVKKYVYAEK